MLFGYLVTHRKKCVDCGGEGVVMHPDWIQYFQENPNWVENPPSDPDEQEWWGKHGWQVETGGLRAGQGYPPEEIRCSSCDGRGIIETEVSLHDALQEVASPSIAETIERNADAGRYGGGG
jgi:hypothetical protein